MKRKFIVFDILINGYFWRSISVPVSVADYVTPTGAFQFNVNRLRHYIESELPSLKNKSYDLWSMS